MTDEQNERLYNNIENDGGQKTAEADAQECPTEEEVARLAAERDEALRLAATMSMREAAVEEVARATDADRREAEAQAAEVAAQRVAAERRAQEASEAATSSTFGFYLVLGILMAILVVGAIWLVANTQRETVTIIQPGVLLLQITESSEIGAWTQSMATEISSLGIGEISGI